MPLALSAAMTTQDTPALSGVGLCLSGGGFRAALFHLGALRRLNDSGVLPRLATVSSVSGGSIASGLLAAVWPSLRADARGRFENFDSVYEASLRAFCRGDRRTGPLLTERLNPLHWPQLASGDQSATNLLADVYVEALVSDLRLQHLEAVAASGGPTFIINACNLQTGANFTFSGARVGEHSAKPRRRPRLRLRHRQSVERSN